MVIRAGGVFASSCWNEYQPSSDDKLEQLLASSMRAGAVSTRAPGTWSNSYSSQLTRFQKFCSERSPPRQVCPAEPMTVCLFLELVAMHANTYSVVKSASRPVGASLAL